ncbi:MAG: putative adhesin [Silvibacterium sp.]
MPTFLCGHGNWHLKDGFARVPTGTQVTFYTQNAKTLYLQEALKILDGTTQFTEGQRDVYKTGQAVPNMTLSDGGADWRAKFELAAKSQTGPYKLVFADEGHPKKLSEIMTFLEGEELVWVACRAVRLNKVSMMKGQERVFVGAKLGVNVRENPTTFFSAYVTKGMAAPTNINKEEFRGFMPAGWNAPKPGS